MTSRNGNSALWVAVSVSLALNCVCLLRSPAGAPSVMPGGFQELPTYGHGRRHLQADGPGPIQEDIGGPARGRRQSAPTAQGAAATMQDGPGAQLGGARVAGAGVAAAAQGPGYVPLGPSALPINQLAENPTYAPGTGQLSDPLSYMWVNPETGRLYIRAQVTIVPAPFTAPPPEYNLTLPALSVWAKGGHGIQVVGEESNSDDRTQAAFVAFNDFYSQAPLVDANNYQVSLTNTFVRADRAPPTPNRAALSVVGREGQPTLGAWDSSDALYATLYAGKKQVESAPMIVWASNGQDDAEFALAVQGYKQAHPLLVGMEGAASTSFDVLKDNSVTSGPLYVQGTLNSTAYSGRALVVEGKTTLGGNSTVAGSAVVGGGIVTSTLATSGNVLLTGNVKVGGSTTVGGDVTVGTNTVGQRSLTVNGRLNVKKDATFEASVEVWRSVTARFYYWWRPNRKHRPFTSPPENTPSGRKLQ